nr:rhodanese-like domain-containing protein [Prevotella sp.]
MKAQSPSKANFTNMNTKQFSSIIDSADVQLLDVRTAEEYDEGHIKNAILIDVRSESFLTTAEKKLDKKKTIAVYCRSGRRSAHAASLLAEKGFKVKNLEDGIIGWTNAGYPITKE